MRGDESAVRNGVSERRGAVLYDGLLSGWRTSWEVRGLTGVVDSDSDGPVGMGAVGVF